LQGRGGPLPERTDKDMTRVFFDMDGVLAQYRDVPYEEMLKEGFFGQLEPQKEALEALRILAEDPGIELYTLSAVIRENPYALDEKKNWLRQQLGSSLERVSSIFPYCGESKAACVPGGIRSTDILIDDYNANLRDWEKSAVAIKFLNGINNRHGSWKGRTAGGSASEIAGAVYSAMGQSVA